jgi:hypothetical protein
MAFLQLLFGAAVTGAILYHAAQTRALARAAKTKRPHVFLAIKGDADDGTKRRAVVLRNGGELPAREVRVRVVRDALIWTLPRQSDLGVGGEERVPFSTLDVCRYGVIGLAPGGEHAIGCLTPAGRWMPDRDQALECTISYEDGEGETYSESVGLEYLA